jgi:hypothetical protein
VIVFVQPCIQTLVCKIALYFLGNSTQTRHKDIFVPLQHLNMESVECVGHILPFNNKRYRSFGTKTTEINVPTAPNADSDRDKTRVAAPLRFYTTLIDAVSADLT